MIARHVHCPQRNYVGVGVILASSGLNAQFALSIHMVSLLAKTYINTFESEECPHVSKEAGQVKFIDARSIMIDGTCQIGNYLRKT